MKKQNKSILPLVPQRFAPLVRVWRDESGVLTLEWILLLIVLCIGVVSGLATLRDAAIYRFFNMADAVGAVNPSYTINKYESYVTSGTSALYTVPASSFGGENSSISSTELTNP